ncbi:hypothetical protein CZP2022_2 [Vibrio phage C-ZP2022]|nr:hypothetical protein CZP2022_2 [Vibrio phage C-ZP2022]
MKKITLKELFEADVLPQEEDEEVPGISIILPDEPVTEDVESLALFAALTELNTLEAAFDAVEVFLSHTGDEESHKIAETRFYASVPESIVLKAGGAAGFKEKAAVKIKQAIAKVKAAITNVLTKFVGDSRVKQLRLESARKGVANGTYFTGVVPLNKSHHAFATDRSGGRSATVDFMNSKQIAATLEATLDSINNLPRALSSLGKLDNTNYAKDLGKILTDLYGFGATTDNRAMSFGFTKDQSLALSVVMADGISPKMVNAKAAIVKAGRVTVDKGDFEKGSETIIKGFAAMPKVQRAIAQYNTQLNEENAKTQSAIARILGITVAMYKETLNGGYRVLGSSVKRAKQSSNENMEFSFVQDLEFLQAEAELDEALAARDAYERFESGQLTENEFMSFVPGDLVAMAKNKESFIKRAGAYIKQKIEALIKKLKDFFKVIAGKQRTEKTKRQLDQLDKKVAEIEVDKKEKKDREVKITGIAQIAGSNEHIHPLLIAEKNEEIIAVLNKVYAAIPAGITATEISFEPIKELLSGVFEEIKITSKGISARLWKNSELGFDGVFVGENKLRMSFTRAQATKLASPQVIKALALEEISVFTDKYRDNLRQLEKESARVDSQMAPTTAMTEEPTSVMIEYMRNHVNLMRILVEISGAMMGSTVVTLNGVLKAAE